MNYRPEPRTPAFFFCQIVATREWRPQQENRRVNTDTLEEYEVRHPSLLDHSTDHLVGTTHSKLKQFLFKLFQLADPYFQFCNYFAGVTMSSTVYSSNDKIVRSLSNLSKVVPSSMSGCTFLKCSAIPLSLKMASQLG